MSYTLTLMSLDDDDKRVLNEALTMLGTDEAMSMRDRVNDEEV